MVVFQKKRKTKNNKTIGTTEFRKIQEEKILQKYSGFQMTMSSANQRLTGIKNRKRVGYGASLMLPVLSYYLDNDLTCLDCIIDDDPKKTGQYYVNLPVRITHSGEFLSLKDSVCLLTSVASRANVRPMLKKLFDLDVHDVIVPLSVV